MNHVTHRMAAWLAGELETSEREEFERHLAGCPACAGEAEQARRVWTMIGTAPAQASDQIGVWPAVKARTTRRSRSDGDWFFGARPWTRRGWAAGAVAAGLVMGMMLPGLWTAGAIEADPADPRLAGTSWQDDDQTTDLAAWWLAADFEEEDGS